MTLDFKAVQVEDFGPCSEQCSNVMKMGLNGVAMSPHGLIFDEDEATGCTKPPEALPTSFKAVFSQF